MSKEEIYDQIIIAYFDLETKFLEISDLFKRIARLHMRLRDSSQKASEKP